MPPKRKLPTQAPPSQPTLLGVWRGEPQSKKAMTEPQVEHAEGQDHADLGLGLAQARPPDCQQGEVKKNAIDPLSQQLLAHPKKLRQHRLKVYPWLRCDQTKNVIWCSVCHAVGKQNSMSVGTIATNFRTSPVPPKDTHSTETICWLCLLQLSVNTFQQQLQRQWTKKKKEFA